MGGIQERKALKESKWAFYNLIIHGKRNLADLEVLCFNCNIIYEYERKKRFIPLGYAGFYKKPEARESLGDFGFG